MAFKKDAVMIHIGVKYRDFIYRFSYDINFSALSAVTGGRGGFEFSLVYVMKKY